MAKNTKKNRPDQKNKQGFDSSVQDTEFSTEFGAPKLIKHIKLKQKSKTK
ncbi:hypothetical protein KGF86_08930 [Ornithinibacillus massiliensis]|uniref:Uncharacterized protein n=1 Tax=Ornithinibacillus massiliensis TaxID=1944633 RepID=A0ABS5ME30_9BACI|nr:hypothetical protein [Ornithinibacillus massiliensis]MBS3680338.1 hypothetical protein [Ornithinibacillus massiliensis]